jgi:hypothetical protein
MSRRPGDGAGPAARSAQPGRSSPGRGLDGRSASRPRAEVVAWVIRTVRPRGGQHATAPLCGHEFARVLERGEIGEPGDPPARDPTP